MLRIPRNKAGQEGAFLLAFFLACCLTCSTALEAHTRRPIPDPATQAKTLEVIREVYKSQYAAAKTPADQAKLAREIYSDAYRSDGTPDEKYVMFRVVKDIAVKAGEIDLAMHATEKIIDDFEVDGIAAKTSVLTVLAKTVPPDRRKNVATLLMNVVPRAIEAGRYTTARQLMETANATALRARDRDTLVLVRNRCRDADVLIEANQKAFEVLGALNEDPDDPAANLAAGKFLAIYRGDWPNAVPLLAKGSRSEEPGDAEPESALVVAARRDMECPPESDGQSDVADAWWDLAVAEEKSGNAMAASAYRARAAYWYWRADRGLSGLAKTQAEQRRKEASEKKANSMVIVKDGLANQPKLPPAPPEAVEAAEALAWVQNTRLVPLTAKDPSLIPENLRGALITTLDRSGSPRIHNGLARIHTRRRGVLYLLVHWGYEGSEDGDWVEERMTDEELQKQGWKALGACPWDNKRVLYKKKVDRFEQYEIRTNKYWPPSVIFPPSKQQGPR